MGQDRYIFCGAFVAHKRYPQRQVFLNETLVGPIRKISCEEFNLFQASQLAAVIAKS